MQSKKKLIEFSLVCLSDKLSLTSFPQRQMDRMENEQNGTGFLKEETCHHYTILSFIIKKIICKLFLGDASNKNKKRPPTVGTQMKVSLLFYFIY